jgi:asparagine synthase (glutamine-hydrolysing)
MCGICGAFGSGDLALVRKMCSLIVHRGPDDEHAVADGEFALGARRLSIIDLAGGRQPLCNEDESVWVAQNGEIYNFPSLRESLIRKGHHFKSRSDTEVLVHLYEEEGEDLAKALNGMFAIALWDKKKKKGMLLRDRPGKKPLYYLRQGGALYFASEIKCLLLVPGFSREIDLEALHHYLSYKHVPAPLTIFKGIRVLPPAHFLTFDLAADRLEIHRYWTIDMDRLKGEPHISEDEIGERLIEILRNAVSMRLISDVPIGFFLSGGLDSSLSTAIAARISTSRIKTFTLTYPRGQAMEGKFEDQEFARKISRQYDTEHYEEIIDFTDLCEEFPKIISHFDEPFAGVISTYFLARLIARHVKVALSGDGADELFGSYLSHRLAYPLYNLNRFRETQDEQFRDFAPFDHDMPYLERLCEPEEWKWRAKLLVFSEDEKRALYSPELREATAGFSSAEHMKSYFSRLKGHDPLNRILEMEFSTFFPDQVLAFVDRLSMAHSLEVRTAFLDPEFISLALSIPGNLKRKQNEVKYILKKAALRYLPAELVFRKKEGFVLPVNQWLLSDMEPYVRESLSTARLKSAGIFSPVAVHDILESFYGGKKELANRVLSILTFQIWHDLYMGSRSGVAS